MKLSIVIPYYNRKQLLLNVLNNFSKKYKFEVIIIDDGSTKENQLFDLQNGYNFNITLIRIEKQGWRGSVGAYNTGLKYVSGDIIMLNSSEVIHVGDVIGYVLNNFDTDQYFAFSTYAGNPEINQLVDNKIVTAELLQSTKSWWHSHSTNHTLIPYCAVLSKQAMDQLGGFDERFMGGIGFDDYDFVDRVKNLGLKTKLIDDPFVLHQYHEKVECTRNNLALWQDLRLKQPDRIKAYVAN